MGDFENICYRAAMLDGERQATLFERLREILTDDELIALQIGIAYCRLYTMDGLRDAMKAALADQLYKEFNNKPE